MIRTIYNMEKQKTNNIIKCNQIDNVQRENVMTMEEEKLLLKRAGQNISVAYKQEVAKIKQNLEKLKNERETFDIIDEKRKLEKAISENKEKYENLSQENKILYEQMKAETETKQTEISENKENIAQK